jgi:PAS domain S-box-containing protein
MVENPTYEELKQRVIELEQQVSEISSRAKALEFTQLMVDRFPGSICCVGADASFVSVNEAGCRALGFPRETLLEMTIHDIAPDFPQDTWSEHWADVKARGSFVVEAHHRNKDGKVFPIEVIGNYLEFDGKEYHSVFVRDITARKQFENSLIESEKKYRMLVDNSNSSIHCYDRDGTILFMNIKAASNFNASPEDLVGKTLYDINPAMAEMLVKRHRDIIDSGVGRVFEDEFQVNSEKVWTSSNVQPFRDAYGKAEAVQIISSDITERKIAEEALVKSEERLAFSVEATKDAIWDLDMTGNKAYASPRCVELMEIQENASLDDTFSTYMSRIHEDHRHSVMHSLIEHLKGNAPYEIEYLYCYDNGETRWLRSQGKALFNEKGEATRIVGSTRDITIRKEAEETLRKSEEEYRNLFDSIPDPVLIYQEGIELMTNRAFTKLLGYDRQDFENGLSPFVAIKEDNDKKIVRERVKKRVAGEEVIPKYHTMNLITKGGKTVLCESTGTSIQYNGRPAVLVIFRDVTERKGAEELIRKLTHELIKSQEIERRRVSSELHDRVGQNLATLRIECNMLVANESLPPDVRQRISAMSDILQTTKMSVRDLSYELRPPGLEEQGLINVLYDYCKKFSENNKLHVDFRFAGVEKLTLSVDTKINLYRLVQEGLNNIWKHADASEATIKLVSSVSKIALHIEDKGRGFNVKKRLSEASDENKMGLRNMEERVFLLNGKMNVQSAPGKGTSILIEIPYGKDPIPAGETDFNDG